MENALIIKIVAVVLVLFIGCYFYFENFKSYPISKRWFLGLIILAAIGFNILDSINNDSQNSDNKHYMDKGFKNTKTHVDSLFEVFSNDKTAYVQEQAGDIQKGEEEDRKDDNRPFSTAHIYCEYANLFKTSKEDSLLLTYRIVNNGTGKAFNLSMSTLVVYYYKGQIKMLSDTTQDSYNKGVELYSGQLEGKIIQTSLLLYNVPRDSIYFCFKIDFSDSSKRKKSFGKIFHVDPIRMIPSEIGNVLYNNIEDFLKRNKHWKPPFRQ